MMTVDGGKDQRALRLTLALWMMPMVLFIFLSSAWLTQVTTAQLADSAYDRSLNGALRAIAANITTQGGGVGVELPYPLFQSLQATADGTVYFRVTTSNGLVEIGDSGLPAAPKIDVDEMRFYNSNYLGQPLRSGALRRALAEGSPDTVLIEVAETTLSRETFLARVGRAALVRDMATTLFGLVLMMLGVNAAIKPLSRLRDQFLGRAASDVSPLDVKSVPDELRPLVQTFNATLARHKDLAQSQRQFLDGAAHQLRTSLSILRMQLDYARRADDITEARATLDAMQPVIDRASHTATQMLALARADAWTVAPHGAQRFDLARIVEDVARMHLPTARARQIRLELDLPAEPIDLRGDETLIYEALSNLVDNALRHSPDRGQVLITLRPGHYVTVADEGPGMSDDQISAIGQRFAIGAQGKTGLGLSIALSVATAHQGTLSARNRTDGTTGRGLVVTLFLPRI